jgi:hypothetical protein
LSIVHFDDGDDDGHLSDDTIGRDIDIVSPSYNNMEEAKLKTPLIFPLLVMMETMMAILVMTQLAETLTSFHHLMTMRRRKQLYPIYFSKVLTLATVMKTRKMRGNVLMFPLPKDYLHQWN